MHAMLRLLKDALRRRKPDPEEGRPILHISDTPWTTFAFVERLARRYNPAWIVHTGDLVDGAKVALFPHAAVLYRKRAVRIIRALEQAEAEIYWVMGNHDIPEFVRRTIHSGEVIEGVAELNLGGLTVRVSHFPSLILQAPAPYNLFGHSGELSSGVREERIYLNGLEHAHLIYPRTGRITKIRYPMGTDDARLLRRRSKP